MRSDSTTAGKLLQETLETEPEFCLGLHYQPPSQRPHYLPHNKNRFWFLPSCEQRFTEVLFSFHSLCQHIENEPVGIFASDCPKVRLITWVSVIRIFLSSTTETQAFQSPPGFPCSFMKFHLVVTYKSNHSILLPDTPVLVEWAHE